MKKKKSSPSWAKGDTWFVAAVLSVSLAASGVLARDFDATSGKGTTQEIGTIVFKQKVAERKLSSEALWGRLVSKAPVYNFDAIRTGEGASAVVTLNDGTEIHLDEETMVGLELRQKAFSVALVRGKLAAKRDVSTTALSVTSQGVAVTMEGGAVTLADEGSSVSLQTDAPVTVTSGGHTATVLGSQTATIAAGGAPVVEKPNVTLLEPAEQAYVLGATPLHSVAFRWQSQTSGPATLQVSTGDFSSVLQQIDAVGQASLDLPEGTYSWRVVAGGAASAPRRLVVLHGAAPVLGEPHGVQAVADTQQALVPFTWSQTPEAASYRLEIFQAAQLTTVFRSLTTTLAAVSMPALPEGSYVWRVVGVYPFANAELASPGRAFEIRKLAKLPTPGVANDTAATKTQFSALAASSVLGWEAVPSADSYEVVIARDPEFRQVVSKTETSNNTLPRPAGLVPGDYYWRVTAVAHNLASDPSAAHEFSVSASLPLVGLTPRSAVSGPRLTLTWNDPNQGHDYRVEVAEDASFSQVAASADVSSTASGQYRSTGLDWSQPGAYFWRVSLKKSGAVPASSEPLAFIVPGGLSSPTLVAPSGSVDVNEVPALVFRWEAVPGANLYRLTLFRTLAGKPQEIFRGDSTGTSLSLKQWDLLALDPYVWTLTAVAADGRDKQLSTDAVGAFSLTQSQKLKAVAVRVPKVIYVQGAP